MPASDTVLLEKCAQCGAVLTVDNNFCPSCSRKKEESNALIAESPFSENIADIPQSHSQYDNMAPTITNVKKSGKKTILRAAITIMLLIGVISTVFVVSLLSNNTSAAVKRNVFPPHKNSLSIP